MTAEKRSKKGNSIGTIAEKTELKRKAPSHVNKTVVRKKIVEKALAAALSIS